ncbi:Cell division protein FtsI [Peptidoglycan synthetase] [hydrothermal vent metagenome]|uniref:Cell division protein FtsI [Peptidoglycan synthetase] n=1 Tax=hydrothermal vent metagenome TaxID=652676 RepID=A0A3B1E2C8_9ZZZZ
MRVRKYPFRFIAVFLFFIVCLVFFAVKLVLIQVFQASHLAALADKQHKHLIEIEPVRGTIYDRNLRPLALNIEVYSLYANPRAMTKKDKQRTLEQVMPLLSVEEEIVRRRLAKSKYFVWLERKLPIPVVEQIKALKIKGLGFRRESQRYYPNAHLAAHIIGFSGVENKGLEGLELFYDKELKGKLGRMQIIRDARQRKLMLEDTLFPPQDGFHLVLTIDETIQYIAERALDEAFQKHNAKAATIIVMDVRTGEILALANRPTYNLSDVRNSTLESRTNRAVSFVYEPGSVFKIVAAAAALEEKEFIETDTIFCENGKYKVANNILHDHRPHGELTFQEVFELSSNIGVTKIAQKIGADMIYKYGKRFRFGMKTEIDLKGEVDGWLKRPNQWSRTSIGAIPIGHEVTVTPIQLVAAIGAIANDGIYMRPFVVKAIQDSHDQIIKKFEPTAIDRVVSTDTARRVRKILTGVVEHGTGQRAQIEGISVAGKTGTAQKVIDGKYSHSKFDATFIGLAPADNPRLAAVVIFDEPKPSYFGGTVSAPVFKKVIESSLRYLETK